MSDHFLVSSPQDLQRTLNESRRRIQEEQTVSKARLYHLPYINLRGFPVDLGVLALFTEQEARTAQSLPFYREGHDVRIATLNRSNPLLQEKLKELAKKFQITLYFMSEASFNDTLKYYKKVPVIRHAQGEIIHGSDSAAKEPGLTDLQDAAAQEHATPTELLTRIFETAMRMNASDIHVEPEDHMVKIRYRIDGVLQDAVRLEKALQKSFITRIKMLSKLKLNVENLPQDGRVTFFFGDKSIDIRVSTLPSAHGEGVVMRLLGTGATQLKLKDLGLQGRAYKVIEEQLAKPNGMIMTTGPTGSGKTTTLYAFLNELNEPGVKIITLEDPVEYKLEGIQQTPIDHHVDFSFAKGLRAVLRQDPDIVMVGEIRDAETAETALQAALTGHVVLSTLHTNDASGAVPRLLVMGIKPFVIAPGLNAIIAQRLVRRLCETCRRVAELQPNLAEKVKKILDEIPAAAGVELPKKLEFYIAPGCDACHNLGYKGRIGIYEVIEVNDGIRDLILKEAPNFEIKKQAVSQGMVTMTQDGLLKALNGITDVEEVFRVAGE